MKKVFLFFLFCFIFISACYTPLEDERFQTENYLFEYDLQNAYCTLLSPIAESEDAYYFQPSFDSDYIWYYDKTTGKNGKLCGKPECPHNIPTCNAYASCFGGISWYDGYLYYVQTTPGLNPDGYKMIHRISADGSIHEMLHEFDSEILGSNMQIRFHRGFIYRAQIDSIVIDGTARNIISITQEQLDNENVQTQVIFEKQYDTVVSFFYKILGNKIYILIMQGYENDQQIDLYCYDIMMQSTEHLLDMKDAWYATDLWVDTENVYIAVQQNFVFRVDTYNLSSCEYMIGKSLESIANYPHLGENIIAVSNAVLNEAGPSYVIMDYDGQVLNEGIIPLSDPNASNAGFSYIGCNSNYVFFYWSLLDSKHELYSKIIAIPIDSNQQIIEMCSAYD